MHRRLVVLLIVAALMAASLAVGGVPGVAAVAASDYTPTRIGGPGEGNPWTQPFDVNNAGTVVGQFQSELVNDNNEQAFRWTSGGGLQLLPLPNITRSNAYAVNEAGQIVGYMFVGGITHAYIWSQAGGMTDLGLLPDGTTSTAYAINDAGVVVGIADDANGTYRPFHWTSAGGMVALDIPPEYFYTFAVGINSNGDIVGTGYTTPDNVNYVTHAFLWPASGGDPVNLGTLTGGSYSGAAGINDAGQVAGVADDANGVGHVFLWSQATGMVDLGLPPGGYTDVIVNAINNLGQIAGYATEASSGDEHAFVWFPAGPGGQGQFFVLGDFGGEQGEIFGNNDRGQLVGYVNNPALGTADRLQGFLLTPNDTTAPTTTATPTGTPGNGGWFRSDVTVNLTATDNPGGFGVARITHSATGAQPIPTTNTPGASTSIALTAEGETILTFYATDNAGNVEVAKTLTVRLDKTGPALSTTLTPATARPGDTVGITIAANESLAAVPTLTASGPCIATIPLTVSAGGTPNTYTSSYLVPAGTAGCTITFAATGTDPAGNPSTGGTATLQVGKFRTALTAVGGTATYGDTTATLTATLTRLDGGGPVPGATLTFRFDGSTYQATTDANGIALIAVPLSKRNAGTYRNSVQASFAGDANLEASSASGPLTIARRILWLKPTDRTVGLRQPNPPTTPPANCLAVQTPTSACWLELTNGSTFAPGDTWSSLTLAQLRFTYNRNPPATNASETIGKQYRSTAFGATSQNYDIRYQPGTLTVK
jgi:probable HAF family extracellular repeat protein